MKKHRQVKIPLYQDPGCANTWRDAYKLIEMELMERIETNLRVELTKVLNHGLEHPLEMQLLNGNTISMYEGLVLALRQYV